MFSLPKHPLCLAGILSSHLRAVWPQHQVVLFQKGHEPDLQAETQPRWRRNNTVCPQEAFSQGAVCPSGLTSWQVWALGRGPDCAECILSLPLTWLGFLGLWGEGRKGTKRPLCCSFELTQLCAGPLQGSAGLRGAWAPGWGPPHHQPREVTGLRVSGLQMEWGQYLGKG